MQNFESFPEKKEHLNQSSERKVMPVLRRTLRVRVCLVVETESDANRVGEELWYDGSRIWDHKTELKTCSKLAIKTQTRTQTQHYGL